MTNNGSCVRAHPTSESSFGGVLLIQIQQSTERAPARTSRLWRWGIPALVAVAILVIVAQIVLARAGPILKGRVIETLRARFDSDVQLDTLQVSIAHGLEVTGSGLRIFPRDDQRTSREPKATDRRRAIPFSRVAAGIVFQADPRQPGERSRPRDQHTSSRPAAKRRTPAAPGQGENQGR